MEFKVSFENGVWFVSVPILGIYAQFKEVDEATAFIQSVIKNVISY